MIDLKLLIKNGVHYGHETSRWNPKMEPYIWGHKDNIHLIDVSKTAMAIEKAAKFLESIVSEGKSIMLVGTKKSAQAAIESVAKELNLPYSTHRWVGGTLTNYRQVKKSVAKFLHFNDVLARSGEFSYTKKELSKISKNADRLEKNVGGIVNLAWPVGAIFIVDEKKENVVIKEAQASGVPIVAIIDTNGNPSGIDYVIPANDDSPKAISVILDYIKEFIRAGQAVAKTVQKEELTAEETSAKLLELEELSEEESKSKRKAKVAAIKPQGPASARKRMPIKKAKE